MKNYIKWIRKKVGKKKIFLNFGVCVVFDSSGRILLQKRGDTNKWGLPGGALEIGESFEAAALRETEEETGLRVKVAGLLGVYSKGKYEVVYPNGDRCQPIVVAFYAKRVGGRLEKRSGKETLDLKYFKRKNLPKITNLQHKDMVKDAFERKAGVWR